MCKFFLVQEALPISQGHFDFELHRLDEPTVRNLIYQEVRTGFAAAVLTSM